MLVLDDLHWSDAASIDLIAALLRRGPEAPVLLALAFRPGQAPERLAAALAAPAGRSASTLEQLSEAPPPSCSARRRRRRRRSPPRRRQPVLPRAARARVAHRREAGRRRRRAGGHTRLPSRPRSPRSSAALAELERALLEGAAVAGEPFEPDLAAAIGELSLDEGLAALDALLARDLLRPTTVPRRFRFRHPLVRRAVYDSAPRRLAAARRTRAPRRAGRARRRAQPSSPTTSSGPRRRATRQAIALLIAAGPRRRRARPAARRAGSRRRCACSPPRTPSARSTCWSSLASAQRSLGELESCRDDAAERDGAAPADAGSRRVELTALCAAVEHWLGRHDDAHRRLVRAWDELPDRSGAAAAALQIELAVDGLYQLDFTQTIERAAARSSSPAPSATGR